MSIECIRGDTKLQSNDLRAHLAAMFRLENIGVFLGAPTPKSEDGRFDEWINLAE